MERVRRTPLGSFIDELRATPRSVILTAAYYGTLVVLCAVQAAIMDRDLFAYDLSMVRGIRYMVVSVCSLWLLMIRAYSARLFCGIGAIVLVSLSLIDNIFCGAYVGIAAETNPITAWVLLSLESIAGFSVAWLSLTSPEFKAFLYDKIDLKMVSDDVIPSHKIPLKDRVRTWPFWRDTAIYFIVFSMLGHWAEILFCNLIIAGVFMGDYDPTNIMLWDQWLFPFSAEGIALVMVVILLHPLKERLLKKFNGKVMPAFIISFLVNAAVCTSIDFLTGMAVNQDYSLWDYRELPFNFMGQVCLQNSMVYSIAATVIVWWVYPAMDQLLSRIPRRVADAIFFAMLGMYIFLAMLYFVVI